MSMKIYFMAKILILASIFMLTEVAAGSVSGAVSSVGDAGLFSNTPLIFSVLIILLVLSGLFSGSETALVSLSMAKVKALKADGVKGMNSVEKLKANANRMLITVLLGNNLVNIAASVMMAGWTEATFGSSSLAIVTAVMTILVLIFGEIFPKTFAQQHAEILATFIARPILIMQMMLFPDFTYLIHSFQSTWIN